MKISDQVARSNPKLIEAVFWSSLLDNMFKENSKSDPELRCLLCGFVLLAIQLFKSVKGYLNPLTPRRDRHVPPRK